MGRQNLEQYAFSIALICAFNFRALMKLILIFHNIFWWSFKKFNERNEKISARTVNHLNLEMGQQLFDISMGPNICTDNLSFALYTPAYGFPATSGAHVEVNGKQMG